MYFSGTAQGKLASLPPAISCYVCWGLVGGMAGEAMDVVTDVVMDVVSEHDVVTSVEANLGFSMPREVIDDHEGRGLKRAITRPLDYDFDRRFEYRRCRVRDCCAPGPAPAQLAVHGI